MENEIYGNWLIRRKENFKLPEIKSGKYKLRQSAQTTRRDKGPEIFTKVRGSWPSSLTRSSSPKCSSPTLDSRKNIPFIITPAPSMPIEDEIRARYHRSNKVRQKTPVLLYENVVMSKDLAIMAQVRRGLISEVTGSKIINLTPDVMSTLKSQFLPDDLKNNESSQQILQRQKANQERVTRHPYATAAYAIRSLSPGSRKSIKQNLKLSLPQGSRFLEYS